MHRYICFGSAFNLFFDVVNKPADAVLFENGGPTEPACWGLRFLVGDICLDASALAFSVLGQLPRVDQRDMLAPAVLGARRPRAPRAGAPHKLVSSAAYGAALLSPGLPLCCFHMSRSWPVLIAAIAGGSLCPRLGPATTARRARQCAGPHRRLRRRVQAPLASRLPLAAAAAHPGRPPSSECRPDRAGRVPPKLRIEAPAACAWPGPCRVPDGSWALSCAARARGNAQAGEGLQRGGGTDGHNDILAAAAAGGSRVRRPTAAARAAAREAIPPLGSGTSHASRAGPGSFSR